MTDVHCHVSCGDAAIREFLIGRDFVGVHPWRSEEVRIENDEWLDDLRAQLNVSSNSAASSHSQFSILTSEFSPGIGEIGLDRLKERTVSPKMRAVFVAQLALAAEFRRPVVLHGAKCWGQVIGEIKNLEFRIKNDNQTIKQSNNQTIPSFLFHGFSRSDGLLSDIVALNGFVSVGPAVLNDHAVNYRALVKKIPLDRLVVETDRTPENAATCPSVVEVAKKVAELRGLSLEELERVTDANAARFTGMGQRGG